MNPISWIASKHHRYMAGYYMREASMWWFYWDTGWYWFCRRHALIHIQKARWWEGKP